MKDKGLSVVSVRKNKRELILSLASSPYYHIAHISGDTQDNHTDHALCRLMMSLTTKKSENFDYTKYIKKAV